MESVRCKGVHNAHRRLSAVTPAGRHWQLDLHNRGFNASDFKGSHTAGRASWNLSFMEYVFKKAKLSDLAFNKVPGSNADHQDGCQPSGAERSGHPSRSFRNNICKLELKVRRWAYQYLLWKGSCMHIQSK